MITTAVLLLTALALPGATAEGVSDSVSRAIRYRVDVPAPIQTVWSDWTDSARVREWFARGSNIEPKPFGTYEILFAPEAPPGQRGAENNIVLAVQAPRMLAFTWDAPPNLPEARKQRTSVVVRFEELSPDRTRVWFEQTGWGRGGEWDQAYDYFTNAWKVVLSLLHYRHTVGPVDWSSELTAATLARHLRQVSRW